MLSYCSTDYWMLKAVIAEKGGGWINANAHFWALKAAYNCFARWCEFLRSELRVLHWTPCSYPENLSLEEVSGRLLQNLPGNGVISAKGEAEDLSADLWRDLSIARVSHRASPCSHCWTLWAPTATAGGGEEPWQTLLSLSRVLRAPERPGPYQIPASC